MFYCDKGLMPKEPVIKILNNEKKFYIEFWGPEGCGYSIGFLKALSDNAILSGIIFAVFGFVLCFGGIKFYKDMLMFFIPIMIAILGFYLYLTIVVKNVEQNN